MTDGKLTRLRTRRTTIISQQDRIKEFVDKISDQTSLPELETRLNALEKYFDNFSITQSAIEDLDEDEPSQKVRAEYEELYFLLRPAILVQIKKIQLAGRDLNDSCNNTTIAENLSGIKLPKITLPTFCGDYTKWTTFYETFNALVHNNNALDNVSRFHYLRSALSESALRAIRSIEITPNNYEIARKLLVDRYDNKKIIAQEHIRHLFSLPTVNKPSSHTIRELVDSVNVHLRALTALGRPALQWDDLIVFLVIKKLDSATVDKWEDECQSDRLPTLKELTTFLEKRCHALEGKIEPGQLSVKLSPSNKSKHKNFKPQKQTVSLNATKVSSVSVCIYCSGSNHSIYKCNKFLDLTPTERCRQAKRLTLCLNCLRKGHNSESCLSRKCQLCAQRHNTLLHTDSLITNPVPASNSDVNSGNSMNFKSNSSSALHSSLSASRPANRQSRSYILLATAVIQVFNKHGMLVTCRALLDSGSQLNFISERLAHELGVKRVKTYTPIAGIGKSEIVSQHKTYLTLRSRVNCFTAEIEAQILPKISGLQPDYAFNINEWSIPSDLQLADPNFYMPNKIDLLIGAELYCQLLSQEQFSLSNGFPTLQKTVFGWIVMGKIPQPSSTVFHCKLATKPSLSSLEKLVHQFWEIERHDRPVKTQTVEEELCERIFSSTTKRLNTGQYCVKLPFRQDPELLGNSQDMATRRFLSLERKLSRNPILRCAYAQFMKEYDSLNHMERIWPDEIPISNYFLPHHGVQKLDSSTTKLRVVFDASAKSSSGTSLNDILMVGPVVQPDLFSIIIRFRTFRYAFTADISKMYRQILVEPTDRKYQLIVWRESPSLDPQIFQLNTVTYGTSAAPYLATRCLHQLACDEYKEFPQACSAIQNSFYVDDCMTGSDSLQQAKALQRDLITVLKKGNFELRKFCANHGSLLESIPEEHKEPLLRINEHNVVKTLGLIWQPTEDIFQINITPPVLSDIHMTKRIILSDIASVFDPLGLVGPVVVLGKIFLQQLWKLNMSWDEVLPAEYSIKWRTYREQLHELNRLKIPRHMMPLDNKANLQIHGFSDSSELAYGACCYLRSADSFGQISVRLICSKSRVVPLKNISLPRLELCAALLLAELVERLLNILQISIQKVFYYTDSSIVLSWLNAPSYTWSTFIANRVAKIQDLSTIEQWKHIPTKENPADLISRGVLAKALNNCSLWFNGPEFLHLSEEKWPNQAIISDGDIPERRAQRLCLLLSPSLVDLTIAVRHNNCFMRLKRIFAYCYRFINNSCLIKVSRSYGPLSNQELDSGLNGLIKNIQQLSFPSEFKALSKGMQVDKSSRLLNLSPFLDNTGIVRVGGRLKNASLPYECKHQIVLPKNHCVTKMLMSYLHVKHLHPAPQALLNISRQTFWPLDGKTLARHVVHQCIRCFKTKPRSINHLMGDLPAERVKPGRPFLTTGIDFCGPFMVHFKLRGKTPVKAYVAVFICFTTKATHLELVTDLSSEAFISALKRFISRRGLCLRIFCDNATNFISARSLLKELKQMFESQQCQEMIQKLCQQDHIEWRPIPPKSPHFGGLWEAAVKAAKYHLVRIVANASLTYEELNTIIIQIEAILNSRPITPLSADPNDLEPLTPGHFLIGEPLTSFPEPDLTDESTGRLTRFRRLQQLQQFFWKRWSSEYLVQLQQRQKWTSPGKGPTVGMLVLLKEENLPPYKWLLGRITQLFPGKDGIPRVAEVKTQFGLYRRAVIKLCPLPVDTSS